MQMHKNIVKSTENILNVKRDHKANIMVVKAPDTLAT